MEIWGLQHIALDARSHFNMTLNVSAGANEVPWTAQNQTRMLIANLQLAQVQVLRTTHLTLGAFSLALTLLMVHRIVSDARRAAAVQIPFIRQPFRALHVALQNVHPAEIFPLVLACGAVIQQVIFVAVQSTSLRSVLSNNCRGLATVTFPAIFITAYVTAVFGIEMAWRAFKYERFAPRGKWSTTICLGIVLFLLLLTLLPTVAFPMYDRCFGSLIWIPIRYELIAICALSILVFSFLLLAALISIQLMRTSDMDQNERIAASRMCYFLLTAALVYVLVLPVEIQAHRRDFMNTLATSRIAEVSLFTSGVVIAFLHLFLRVNATRTVINPVGSSTSSPKQKRPKIRFFGPSDLEMNISGPIALQGGRRPESRQGLIDVGPEKNRYEFDPEYFARPNRPLSPGSIKSQGAIDPSKWPLPPDPVQTSYVAEPKENTAGLHKRNKSSYSLFPTRAEEIPRLPATVYSPPKSAGNGASNLAVRRQTRRSSLGDAKSITDVGEAFNFLAKPAPLFASQHRRGESTDSSATVQIGLRFSVAPATLVAGKCTRHNRAGDLTAPPPLNRGDTESSEDTLGLPIQSPSTPSASPDERISRIAFPEPPQPAASPTKGKTAPFPVSSPGAYLQSQRDKVLPPTPKSFLQTQTQAPQPTVSRTVAMSGLRMNPVSPASPALPATPATPSSPPRSATTRNAPSPTARIPLGEGTMARSPPPNGWI